MEKSRGSRWSVSGATAWMFTAGIGLMLGTVAVSGHHSPTAAFDSTKPVKVTGAVSKVSWVNPHTVFFVDVKADDGTVTTWGWEMASPNALMRSGWTRDTMKIGDVVTVEGVRSRDGSNHALMASITMMSTGKRLFAGQADEK